MGAHVKDGGVSYRIWAPLHNTVEIHISDSDPEKAPKRIIPMTKVAEGYFRGFDAEGAAGDLYQYSLGGTALPDYASRWQPNGVHGASMVIDPGSYAWQDSTWHCPALRDLVIYELHIGTFTPEGTFRSAIPKLKHLRSLGITALEIMPIGDFPGGRNWGYDGVYLYAPSRAYGHPDDLRALVDAAHAEGLAVILDVVYNHFGPDGNYLGAYIGDYIDESEKTPWGGALRYGKSNWEPLRDFVKGNPVYWIKEFHIDGFRLDATHAIKDYSPWHILQELTAVINHHGGFAIAEDERRDPWIISPHETGGMGFTGTWADDFHHSVRVANTGENESYFAGYTGELKELICILRHGWIAEDQGDHRPALHAESFIHCISNHDQVGNRAFGERLSHGIPSEAYKAASALLCLTPYTPLLFMGQEWAASTPFLFFTDHHGDLAELITAGRRDEFSRFEAFRNSEIREQIPDPQRLDTYVSSKLNWEDLNEPQHASILALYRDCLHLRNHEAAFKPTVRDKWLIEALEMGIGCLWLRDAAQDWLVLFDLKGGHQGSLRHEDLLQPLSGKNWTQVLSTQDERYGKSEEPIFFSDSLTVHFEKPGLIVLRASSTDTAMKSFGGEPS